MTKKTKNQSNEEDFEWYHDFLFFWQKNYAPVCRWVTDWTQYVYYSPTGIYLPISMARVDEIIFNWMDQTKVVRTLTRLSLAHKSIQANQHFCANLKDFDADLNIRNLTNGLLNLTTKKLTKHTATYLSLRQADVEFQPNHIDDETPCWISMWHKFPKAMAYIEWHNRAIIYNNMNDRLSLWLVGPRGAGKGSVLDVMDAWYHNESSFKPFEEIGESFGMEPLLGQMQNIVKEGNPIRLTTTTVTRFKTITGRDGTISVNRKGRPAVNYRFIPFFFSNAYNLLPSLPPNDIDAFLDRCIIAEFDQRSIQDPTFKDRLQLEKHIIFTQLVMIGYTPFFAKQMVVWKNGEPTVMLHHDYWIKVNHLLWDKWSNPVRSAIEFLFERDPGTQRIPVDDVTDLVTNQLTDDGTSVPADKQLKPLITKALAFLGIRKSHTGSNYYYAPIRLKNTALNNEYITEHPENTKTDDPACMLDPRSGGLDTFFH